jgi:hypothetical protein
MVPPPSVLEASMPESSIQETRDYKCDKEYVLTEEELSYIRESFHIVNSANQEVMERLFLSEYRRLMEYRQRPFILANWALFNTFGRNLEIGQKKRKSRADAPRKAADNSKGKSESDNDSLSPHAKRRRTNRSFAVDDPGGGMSISRRPPNPPRRGCTSVRPRSTMSSQEVIKLMATEPRDDRDSVKSDGASEDEDYPPPEPPRRGKDNPPPKTPRRDIATSKETKRRSSVKPKFGALPPIPRFKVKGKKARQGNHRFDHGQIQEMLSDAELRQIRPGYGTIPEMIIALFGREQNSSLRKTTKGLHPEWRRIRITRQERRDLLALRNHRDGTSVSLDYEPWYTGNIPLMERIRGDWILQMSLDDKRKGKPPRRDRKEIEKAFRAGAFRAHIVADPECGELDLDEEAEAAIDAVLAGEGQDPEEKDG